MIQITNKALRNSPSRFNDNEKAHQPGELLKNSQNRAQQTSRRPLLWSRSKPNCYTLACLTAYSRAPQSQYVLRPMLVALFGYPNTPGVTRLGARVKRLNWENPCFRGVGRGGIAPWHGGKRGGLLTTCHTVGNGINCNGKNVFTGPHSRSARPKAVQSERVESLRNSTPITLTPTHYTSCIPYRSQKYASVAAIASLPC